MATRRYTAAQREAADQARRDQITRMHDQLAERMKAFDERDSWQAWLRFSRNFHRYSMNNSMWIWIQAPEATLVAGYRAWQAKGHQVRKGEKAIKVMAPILRKVPLLDSAGNPVLDANGNERLVRQLVGVKLASVFDVSQVDPAPPPRPEATLLKGQAPPGLWDSLIEFAAKEGFNVERGPCGRANGFIDFEGHFIRVRDDIDELAQTKTLVHEIGHGLTMGPAERLTYAQRGCRGIREVEAESIAYVVLQAHDVDSSGYTFNYVAGWATQAAGGDSAKIDQVIHATGEKVIAAAHRILAHTQPDATAEGDLIDARAGEVLMLIAPAVPGGTREQASGGPVPKWETVTAPTLGSQSDLPLDGSSLAVTTPAI